MKILTLNCRGLNNKIKRKMYFKEFMKYSICCLQETYVTQLNAKLWQSEWSGSFFFSPGTANSKGMVILLNRNLNHEEIVEVKINDRCLGISFKMGEQHFVIFNIYAPAVKEERVDFINNLPNLSLYCKPGSVLLTSGDFNMILNNNLDITSGLAHSQREISAFSDFLTKYDLFDTWRNTHLSSKEYSWIRMYKESSTFTARRLDYILLNNSSRSLLKDVNMLHFSSTDHKAVVASIEIESFVKGQSLWKFNDDLLEDALFIENMTYFINNHYENLLTQHFLSRSMVWDLLKIGIRDECISYVRNKKVSEWSNERENNITKLTNAISLNPHNKTALKEYLAETTKKEIYELSKARGALKRSRSIYIDLAEKNTKYFLQQERSNQRKQVITEIYNKNNLLINNPTQILSELHDFYKTLMNESDINIEKGSELFLTNFLSDYNHPILNDEEKTRLDAPITPDELKNALKSLNRDSSPGCDGLTPLFYLSFWNCIKYPIFECLNDSINNQFLSLSQRRSIITLLPKGSGDENKHMKMYRPISLTNTDYKLISKVLANRLQTVLKKLINNNQVGYVVGRSINDHIRLIDDILNFSNYKNLSGMVVSLDYQKAFDTVNKQSILTALRRFNLGENFIRYVNTLISNTEASVKNANWFTRFFGTDRGVRQGCCLSPLLFILVVELLSIKIRGNRNIVGMLDNTLDDNTTETKVISYADDMSLFLKSSESLNIALKEIDDFRLFSGLVLNRSKSIGMRLGNNVEHPAEEEGLKWLDPKENIKILGIFFNPKKEASLIEENWNIKIESIKSLIIRWSKRNISIWGKCLISKTYLLSKINYIIQSLSLPDSVLKEIDNLIFKYLWKQDTNTNGFERINRKTLCLSIKKGGLSMISIIDQQHVMLLRWLYRLHSRYKHTHTHFKIVNYYFKQLGGFEYSYFNKISLSLFNGLQTIRSSFWKKALTVWLSFNKSEIVVNIPNRYIPIFNNHNIQHNRKPLFIRSWLNKHFKFAHQFFINDRIKTMAEIQDEVGHYGGLIFDYLAVRNAITKRYNSTHFRIMNLDSKYHTSFDTLNNKQIRSLLTGNKNHIPTCIQLWQTRLNINITEYFNLVNTSSKESRLLTLHFKIIHNIYPTNILLNKMGIKQSNICNDCKELDTLTHFFFNCLSLRSYWKHIEFLLTQILKVKVQVNTIIAMFGIKAEEVRANRTSLNEANFLIILAKVCISKYKYAKTTPQNLRFILDYEIMLRKKYFKVLDTDNLP